jgi:hypothetical protein
MFTRTVWFQDATSIMFFSGEDDGTIDSEVIARTASSDAKKVGWIATARFKDTHWNVFDDKDLNKKVPLQPTEADVIEKATVLFVTARMNRNDHEMG